MTVTELSQITGYSISTVSKALSDSKEIGLEAKEKILKAAKETGYYDKAVKRRKRIGMPKIVGIVFDGYNYSDTTVHLCEALRREGIEAVVSTSADAVKVFEEYLGVDAILFMGRERRAVISTVSYSGSVEKTVSEIINLFAKEGKKSVTVSQKKQTDESWLL